MNVNKDDRERLARIETMLENIQQALVEDKEERKEMKARIASVEVFITQVKTSVGLVKWIIGSHTLAILAVIFKVFTS